MYKLLAQTNSKAEIPDYLIESPSAASSPSEFLSDAVFAGCTFHLPFYVYFTVTSEPVKRSFFLIIVEVVIWNLIICR